jgi:hypothetical protein
MQVRVSSTCVGEPWMVMLPAAMETSEAKVAGLHCE